SRNWTGMSRRRASSAIGTGASPPTRPSSTSARSAYGDLVVIEIMATGLPSSWHATDATARGLDRPLRAAAGPDGRDLRPLRPAPPENGAGHARPDPAQDRAHGRVRPAVRAVAARARRERPRRLVGGRDRDRLRDQRRVPPVVRRRSRG